MKYIDMQKQTINTQKGITQRMNYHISCIGMQTFYTNGQCLKNYLLIVVDNGKKSLNSMKTLQKMIIKLNIPKFTMIYHFYLKK